MLTIGVCVTLTHTEVRVLGRVSHSDALSDEIRSGGDLQGWEKGICRWQEGGDVWRKGKAGYCPLHGQHVSTPATLPDNQMGGEKKGHPRPSSKHFLLSPLWLSIFTSSDVPPNELLSLRAVFREVWGKLSTVHRRAKLLKAWLRPIENIRR